MSSPDTGAVGPRTWTLLTTGAAESAAGERGAGSGVGPAGAVLHPRFVLGAAAAIQRRAAPSAAGRWRCRTAEAAAAPPRAPAARTARGGISTPGT